MHRGLVNHKKRFIMFWSPKVACQHQKKWFIKSNGIFKIKNSDGDWISVESNDYNPHEYCNKDLKHLIFRKMTPKIDSYYKFIILRDPAERLVSFYKDKILMKRWGGHGSAKRGSNNISLYHGRAPKDIRGFEDMNVDVSSLSFNDLVTLLYRYREHIYHFDNHIGMQKKAYRGISLDYIGSFSNFSESFGALEVKYSCKMRIRADNSTSKNGAENDKIHLIKASDLIGKKLPPHRSFINDSNIEFIKEIYNSDYEAIEKRRDSPHVLQHARKS